MTVTMKGQVDGMRHLAAILVSVIMLCLMGLSPVIAQGRSDSSGGEAEKAIRAVLERQTEDWNSRRLEAFMQGYWKSPELSFFSGGKKITGWDATLERYRKNYQAEGREMGRLAFSDLDLKMLGPESAVVRGRFELTLSDGSKPTGIFTLIFRKLPDGWKIVHDHTSSG